MPKFVDADHEVSCRRDYCAPSVQELLARFSGDARQTKPLQQLARIHNHLLRAPCIRLETVIIILRVAQLGIEFRPQKFLR